MKEAPSMPEQIAASAERRLVAPDVARDQYAGGISDSTLRRLIQAGDFPAPVVLSRDSRGRPARIAFVVDELVAWVNRKIATGRGPEA
jgi:predicted DNA-binding transcriptional regulator AlpA